ncbi:MAG: hypothetical protein F8N37_00270 [Telmatospirillum sp.]|nr:hypothetical protein [Telmatospirillum sp.]
MILRRPRIGPAVAAFLLAAAPALADPPIDYKEPPPDPPGSGGIGQPDPGHLKGTIPDRIIPPGPFQRLPAIDETRWVILSRSEQPYWTVGKADPVLTNACQLGDFGSLTLNRMVVRFEGPKGRALLQVVPPTHRHLLIDRRGLSRPGEIYYFLNTGLSTCEVWFAGKGAPRSLTAPAGTSLPPPDKKALAKRKAQIKSWPKQ